MLLQPQSFVYHVNQFDVQFHHHHLQSWYPYMLLPWVCLYDNKVLFVVMKFSDVVMFFSSFSWPILLLLMMPLRQIRKKLTSFSLVGAVEVVKWSPFSPFIPTIRVWILLKPIVFSVKFAIVKNENKQKRPGLANFLKKF